MRSFEGVVTKITSAEDVKRHERVASKFVYNYLGSINKGRATHYAIKFTVDVNGVHT